MTRTSGEVGRIVKQRRESLHLTREDLVEKANTLMNRPSLSTATVTIIEGGTRDSFRSRTLAAVARGLDWPEDAVTRLFDGAPLESIETVVWTNPASAAFVEHEARITELERKVAELLGRLTPLVAVTFGVGFFACVCGAYFSFDVRSCADYLRTLGHS